MLLLMASDRLSVIIVSFGGLRTSNELPKLATIKENAKNQQSSKIRTQQQNHTLLLAQAFSPQLASPKSLKKHLPTVIDTTTYTNPSMIVGILDLYVQINRI